MAQQLHQQPAPHAPQQSILYASRDRSIILLDIPASIAGSCPLRLLSVEPLSTPHILPEPKDPTLVFNQELLDTHTRLRDAIVAALDTLRKEHGGEWCLERKIGADVGGGGTFMTEGFGSNLGLLQAASEEPLDVAECEAGACFDITDVYRSIVCNSSTQYRSLTVATVGLGTHNFILPPNSSFLLASVQSSISIFRNYASTVGLFNFILLDPPWPNRSAERSKSTYHTLPNHKDLLLLPLETSLRDNGLVAVWVTNKSKWRQFVLQRLFPKWGVEYAGEWVWLKVTRSGEPIFNLDSVMRKPYEILLFGRKPPSRKQLTADYKWRRGDGGERLPSPNVDARSRGSSPQPRVTIMPQKTIVAVLDSHSRKPCLKGERFPALR